MWRFLTGAGAGVEFYMIDIEKTNHLGKIQPFSSQPFSMSILFHVNLFPCLSFSSVEKGNLFPVWKKATFFQSTFFHVYHFPHWKKVAFFQCGKRQPFSGLPFSMSTFFLSTFFHVYHFPVWKKATFFQCGKRQPFSSQPFSMSIIFRGGKRQPFSSVKKGNLFPVYLFTCQPFSCQPFSMPIIFRCCKIQPFSSLVKFNLFLVYLFPCQPFSCQPFPCLSFSGVEKGNLFPVWKKATFFRSTFFHVYHFPVWEKATFFQCGKRQPFSCLPFSMSTFFLSIIFQRPPC